MEIYTLGVASGAVRRVTTNLNKGSARGTKNDPNWSPDGAAILFSAVGPNGSRNAPCGSFVNFELFQVAADGSGKILQITNTVGSGVETTPRVGWR
jgi:Tol biopolymer transport system component